MASKKGLIAGVVGTLLIGAAWSIGPFVFEGRDDPKSLDSRPVRAEALVACEEMQERLAGVGGPEAENVAVEAMVGRLRRLGSETLAKDVPTESWLADWEQVVATRRAGAPFPRANGRPVHRRMDDLVKDLRPCQFPPQLIPGR